MSGCPLVDSERYKTLVDITRLPDNVIFDRLAIDGHCRCSGRCSVSDGAELSNIGLFSYDQTQEKG